jgi:uncharacterized protein DUF1629
VPYLIGPSLSDTRSVKKEFDPPITMQVKRPITFARSMDAQGKFTEPLRAEDLSALSRTLRVGKPRRGGMPHILGWSTGPWIVSSRVRDVLKELEPNVHEFVPIVLKSLDLTHTYGTYYLIILRQALGVLVEETDFYGGWGRVSNAFAPTGSIVFKSSVICGHHLWRGTPPLDLDYFCSDEFAAPLRAESLDGWRFARKCLVRDG